MKSNTYQLENWKNNGTNISREIVFNSFMDAIKAMNLIAVEAEKLNHHPNWSNVYNTLSISLFTHTKNDVTDLDYELATQINRIVHEKFEL
ncbi:MAG: 4a-hydroxytetrahydrobiopterin dehydratase [Flavobacteriales bacterium]|jgi:4a-hydroxytetrahydrobiopterin dehydratase|tara:strand:+ start:1121 stop:1393 length:273 start_codon:yes stop_codon:yes gene_type:complete